MKKVFFIAAFAIFGLGISNAQEITFGVKAGLNLANIKGDVGAAQFVNSRTKTGFHIGVVAEIPFATKFALAPELLYSSQGAKVLYMYYSGESRQDFKLDYITLPLMVKCYVTNGLSIEVGPQVGFLMSAKVDYSFSGETNNSESTDIKELMSDTDFGFNLGAGYKLNNGLFFQARYGLGLSNAFDGFTKRENRVFQFSVGYMF